MHLRAEELELYLRGRMLDPQASQVSSHLAGCVACSRKLGEARVVLEQSTELSWHQSTHPVPHERRRNARVPSNDPAVIKLIHPTVSEALSARILNVSQDGMRVEVSRLLEPGTTVEILLERTIAIAEVRYCIRVGDGYHAGVSIQNAFAKPPTRP